MQKSPTVVAFVETDVSVKFSSEVENSRLKS